MNNKIGESELIINSDGSIFHLHLLPENLADTVILVGDPGRVEVVSSFFDKIEVKKQNREFVTHTGTFKNKRISVISTGIGTDNIDIVLNELDALKNIDLQTRQIKEKTTSLDIVRIGTSGSLQEDIPVDTPVAASIGLGFDSMINFYAKRTSISNEEMENDFVKHTHWNKLLHRPYFVEASEKLLQTVAKDMIRGITISAPGFYGPQGRQLRLSVADPQLNEKLRSFKYEQHRITNFEMECSAIYGLSKMLGHNALTICNIIANRYSKQYSNNYKEKIKGLIQNVLENLSQL